MFKASLRQQKRKKKRIYLVTNAHRKGMQTKNAESLNCKTTLMELSHRMTLGIAKQEQEFWEQLTEGH